MPKFVIEAEGQKASQVGPWSRAMANALGVAYSKTPPQTPFATPKGTLREVIDARPEPLRWQTLRMSGEGVNEAGEWQRDFEAVDPDGAALDAIRDQLKADVDRTAEAIRARYATTIWGQETVYLEKEAEAKALDADPDLSESDTPYITAEAAESGISREELKQEILANSVAWRGLSVGIEARRAALKRAIANADLDSLRAIDLTSGWPT